MEFAKVSQNKDRFIKGSISSLPERFRTKWEITDDHYCTCKQDLDSEMLPGAQISRVCHWRSPSNSEDDENHVYRALLQSEVLDIDPDWPMTDMSSSRQKYSFLKYSELLKKETISKPMFLRTKEKIPKSPFKVLDAPALKDDFYLNLIDWSNQNLLAVGLGQCIYLWNASTSKVTKLYDLGRDDLVTSVAWANKGAQLGVGTNNGDFQLWDTEKWQLVKTILGHESRIGAIAWNDSIVSTGSRDKSILHRDIRSDTEYEARLTWHKQEICGLKWSFDKQQLASGGNDNKLCLWSIRNSKNPVAKFSSHQAAVKALAWSPHQHGLLSSGGGTADRCIKFWNTLTLQEIDSIETGSQVCNLMFSKNVNELVSTHGYSQNQIILWKYPSMSKVTTLTGHTYRVLYLAMSPDGETIVTGAGDETLRFWKVFPKKKLKDKKSSCVAPSFRELR